MEVEVSAGGNQCLESQLTQNSQITVTIDDLTEGLIVVSFAHSNNLYQGVLFQLNRERGIPSGISFAKEHVLGTSSLEKCEPDPSQATPLSQRHSYNNQGNCHGTSHTTISQPSLRRIIKPPARFKNARMSLRLRARPVLCAKCRSLCDDKSDGGKDESTKDETTTDKTKKDRPKGSKEPAAALPNTSSIEMKGKLIGSETCAATVPTADVDPKDLCYDSVGSTRVVENYWRRPLVKPLIPSTEETYARLRKHKAPSENSRETRKKVKATSSGTETASISTSSSGDHPPLKAFPESNGIFVTKSNVCDNNFPNTRSRKALNLKMCITKIAEMRKGEEKKKKGRVKQEEPLRIQSPVYHHSDSSLESVEVPDQMKSLVNERTSSDECSAVGGQQRTRGSKKSKAWENRIRTKSTVPVRFRDESYLTKNIFNFNKRRPLTNGGDIPVLTICRSDDENTFKVSTGLDSESVDTTVSTSKVEEGRLEEETPMNTVQSSTPSTPPPHLNDDGNGKNSPSSSSHAAPPPISIKSTIGKSTELIKTPTIKITFGSSGNGMVVQIPPKITEPLATDLKAVRKAMKKAKKEAKRRRSISPQLSPSSHAFSPDYSHATERSNPPSPSTLGEIELGKEGPPCNQPVELSSFHETLNEPSTSLKIPKKKKKQKKRRRNSRVFKENDGFTSSSSSHEPVPCIASSPHSTSTYCNERGDESPSGSSIKSCNQEESSGVNPLPTFYKDSCPLPRRRRSMPASSTTSNPEAPRVCINLKRIDTNAYVPLPLHNLSSHSDNDEPSSLETNGTEAEDEEINDFPIDNINPTGSDHDVIASNGESVEFYKDKETECYYRKGDVVWGKLPACPWWPGKIDDILAGSGEETCAKVSWYKSTTQSCVRFKMLVPFAEYFDSKYARSRRRGLYQHAVKDALVEAHKLNPGVSPSD